MQQVAVITGCSEGGIGHALAEAFAEAGFRVVATGRSLESMTSLELHPDVELLQLDVTSPHAAIEEVVEGVVAKFGHIDVLINNAGTHCIGPLAEVPLDMLERCYKTNVFGPLSLVRAVVPHMAARRKGKIANVGSISAFCPAPWAGGYASSKAALHSLTETLRYHRLHLTFSDRSFSCTAVSLASALVTQFGAEAFGIDVILVVPGGITSNIGKQVMTSKQSLPGLKLFQAYEPFMEKRASVSQSGKATPSAELARTTLQAVRQDIPPRTVVYGSPSFLYSVLYYAPSWMRDYVMERIFGLHDRKPLEEVISVIKLSGGFPAQCCRGKEKHR